MQKKYGFVYLWFDRIKGKFYIGCHWGREDDGYICSSKWMRDAYRYRPQAFKRRILARIYTNRKDLFEEEFRYLNMIKNEELGKRYYNLSRVHPHHWSTDPNSTKTVSQKIKDSRTPEFRQKLSKLKTKNNPMHNPETVKKAQESRNKNNPDLGIWQRGRPASEEQKAKQSAAMKGREPPNKGKPSPRRGIKTGAVHCAKQYQVTYPNGDTEVITNLKSYCISKGYAPTAVHNAMSKSKTYRGMKIELIE